MTKRRNRGEGGLHWDKQRQRWIASVTVGYNARGKRIVKRASGTTKTEAKGKLKDILRDYEDGLTTGSRGCSVADAARYWLRYGLSNKDSDTASLYTVVVEKHIIPALGTRKLGSLDRRRELAAEDVDKWLHEKSDELSTRTLRLLHSVLSRVVTNAQARNQVQRNVVAVCQVPRGRDGRPSKSLTLDQARAVLAAAEGTPMHAYIVLSLLIGARTEELRALRWDHVVGHDEDRGTWRPVSEAGWDHEKYAVNLWRSVRAGGETKNRKSRRTLALPKLCVTALRAHQERQRGRKHTDIHQGLVFASRKGTERSAGNVRRDFRAIVAKAGLTPEDWTPREMRHSFVSLLSDNGVPIEDISRIVGHSGTAVTETVYRKQIRPVIVEGATAMDAIFGKLPEHG